MSNLTIRSKPADERKSDKRRERSARDPSLSVYEALWQRLPDLKHDNASNKGNVKSSGKSTIRTDAPRFLIEEDIHSVIEEDGESYFRLAVQRKHLMKWERTCRRQVLQTERSHNLTSEAAVSDATRMYLIHQVNVAIQALCTRGTIGCVPENTQLDSTNSRTDFEWIWIDEHRDLKTQKVTEECFAVVELKKRKSLFKDEFKKVTLKDLSSAKEFQSLSNLPADKDSFLTGNARWISKQARKYADDRHTPFVAAFDWTALVLFRIPPRKIFETGSFPIPPKQLTKWTWFEERGPTSEDNAPGMTFSSILLGYLIAALADMDRRRKKADKNWKPVLRSHKEPAPSIPKSVKTARDGQERVIRTDTTQSF